MKSEEALELLKDYKNKSNKELTDLLDFLQEDFEKNQEPYGYDTESLKYENFYTLTNSIYSNYLKKNINTIKEYNFDNKKESLNNITKIISKK